MSEKIGRSAGWSITALCLLALTPGLLSAQTRDARRPKKLIEAGWDQPNTRTLRANLAVMEQRPFDGVVISAIGRSADGKPRNLHAAFINEVWQREWYQNCIDDLKACHFQRFTDNFLVIGANPGNVDWFDDAGWKNIVDHWRIAAWLAKQAGVKGLLFDSEAYQEPFAQFRYASQPQTAQHSFQEYCEKARQRGREVMQTIAAEYPDLTIFCYFMQSLNLSATGYADPRAALLLDPYGLYPAFLDGWLDAIPPTITLVDGYENAYRFNSQRQFLEACVRIKGDCQELVSPENRAKYRNQVQASFGFYLDAYWNAKDAPGNWYIDGLGGSRLARLQANLGSALGAADEYVWIYGEKFCWWSTAAGNVRPQSWPEVLPGCDEMLRLARDPQGVGRQRIAEARQAAKLTNLLANGDFSAATVSLPEGGEDQYQEGGPPAGWKNWSLADRQGTRAWDRQQKTVRLANVDDGGLRQVVTVEPEQFYAIRGLCKQQGHGNALLRIHWQNADGEGLAQDCFLWPVESVNDWSETFRVLQVPEQATQMVVLLWAWAQGSTEDVAWFDDVEVYRIP